MTTVYKVADSIVSLSIAIGHGMVDGEHGAKALMSQKLKICTLYKVGQLIRMWQLFSPYWSGKGVWRLVPYYTQCALATLHPACTYRN